MTRRTVAGLADPANRWLFLVPWLIGYIAIVLLNLTAVALQLFPDPDDTMRLIQVRDWIGGQSWFDLTQYRMNPPEGAPMHWSRLVDLPIAALILLFRPLVGQGNAEMIALIGVPMLTLGVLMALVGAMARRLMTPGAAFLAVVATPFSMAALLQLAPLRIDHHGWQLVAGTWMAVGVLSQNDRRAGLIAGVAAAAWLNISVEALPFAAAVGAWFAIQWLRDSQAKDRLRFYSGSLAAVSLILFVLLRAPGSWSERSCDAVSSAHVGGLLAASAICWFAARRHVANRLMRLLVLSAAGIAAIFVVYLANPLCVREPFASLDPLVRHYWYDRVLEGLPIWRQRPLMAIAALTQPVIGFIGGALAWSRSAGSERRKWEAYLFLLFAATAAAMLVIRAAGLANVLGLAGTAFLAAWAFRHAREIGPLIPRVVATAAALCLVLPAYSVPLAFVAGPDNAIPQTRLNGDATPGDPQRCLARPEMQALRGLPAGDIAAPLDISPAILVHTDHRAIASSHHRNMGGMLDVIRLFAGAPAEAQAILLKRDIEFVVVCPAMAEVGNFKKDNPAGLWAQLAAGKSPDWLEPVSLPGLQQLRVWRVRKDKLIQPLNPTI